jgi:4-hydroxy-tetrahydrodipicolinate reductase
MIRVAVCGACGRMGRLIIKQIIDQADMKLVAAIDAPRTPDEGKDAGALAGVGKLDVKIVSADKLAEVLKRSRADVLVDFTKADAAVQSVKIASEAGVAVIVGTTGFTGEQLAEMERVIRQMKIRAVISPNMSVGVNVFFKSVRETARLLGSDYGAEIVETHHAQKRDAPSGTARRAAQIIAEEFDWSENKIKIKSIREGDIVGDHVVIFSTPEERVEITHRALSRDTFAVGVIKAIRHVIKKGKAGVVQDMQDVLGLK